MHFKTKEGSLFKREIKIWPKLRYATEMYSTDIQTQPATRAYCEKLLILSGCRSLSV